MVKKEQRQKHHSPDETQVNNAVAFAPLSEWIRWRLRSNKHANKVIKCLKGKKSPGFLIGGVLFHRLCRCLFVC